MGSPHAGSTQAVPGSHLLLVTPAHNRPPGVAGKHLPARFLHLVIDIYNNNENYLS